MAEVVNGAGIWEIPPDEVLDHAQIDRLVEHTANTWQTGRKREETLRDTVQGKKAEYAFACFLKACTRVRYLSYDDFRRDAFLSHAPFDGLLYRQEIAQAVLDSCIEQICAEIAAGNGTGVISPRLRQDMEKQGIFTMEVKSSVLKDRLGDFRGVSGSLPRSRDDCAQIVRNIERWDFFVYPHFTRTDEKIQNFYDYTEYVKCQYPDEFSALTNEKFLQKLMRMEFDHASDVYTRLYFDYEAGMIYIPGYILKEDFFTRPQLAKMPGDKSGKALYYMHTIGDRKSFCQMPEDGRIWNFSQEESYKRLLVGVRQRCICGGIIRYCNSKKNRTYFCKCFDCKREYPFL